jgi:hypothetical protein
MAGNVAISITTITDPTVVTPVNINCGQQAILSATPGSGMAIQWYTVATGGTAFATGSTTNVSPTANSTYYAEAYTSTGGGAVSTIGTTATNMFDASPLIGDDRGGLAVSANYVYLPGDTRTLRMDKSNLGNPNNSFPTRDGFFSDLANGDLWQMGTTTSAGASQFGGSINRLYGLTEALVPNGNNINLSQTISFAGGSTNFVAAGSGFVID